VSCLKVIEYGLVSKQGTTLLCF